MAHNNYIKPGGVWPLLSLLTSGLMAQVDNLLFKSLNADDGGTWAPTSPIIIGGSGLIVNGPFSATNSSITIPDGKFLTIAAGGTLLAMPMSQVTLNGDVDLDGLMQVTGEISITPNGVLTIEALAPVDVFGGLNFYSGSFFIMADGAMMTLNAGSTILSEGDFYLGENTNLKLSPPRAWSRESLMVVNLTYNGGTPPADPDVWLVDGSEGVGIGFANSLETRPTQSSARYHWIKFTDLPPDADLASVTIKTKGISANATSVLPKYQIIRWKSNGAVAALSLLTTDVHIDWSDYLADIKTTTIAPSSDHKIDPTYNYGLLVKHGYDPNAPSGHMRIYSCSANGTTESGRTY